jgi:hypothetical protein
MVRFAAKSIQAWLPKLSVKAFYSTPRVPSRTGATRASILVQAMSSLNGERPYPRFPFSQ